MRRVLSSALCALITYMVACATSPADDASPNDGGNAERPRGSTRDAESPDDADSTLDDGGDSGPVDGGAPTSGFVLPADGGLPALRKVETEHLGQLTGTAQNPTSDVGIVGTDLGASFERDGKLVFVFGDSWTPGKRRQDQDSFAWTTSTKVPAVGSLPSLTWITDATGQFVAPRLPLVNLGGMNVPMEGVPVGPKTYVFFTSGWNESTHLYSNSVLAEMNGLDVAGMTVAHNVASKKFINVSVIVEGQTAFIYGSGDYRASPVYLAKVDVDKLANRSAWTYLQTGSGSSAVFGPGESTAQAITSTPCVGELSVRKWEKIGLYFMAYNCGQPRGVVLRWARSSTGPWSEQLLIFDPGKDGDAGYEHFIHANQSVTRFDDGLSEPDRYDEWGGEYGPYFVPRWFSEEPDGVLSLVYVLSSWNPYQAHLMKTRIALASNPIAAPTKGSGLPKAKLVNGDFTMGLSGWSSSGDNFGVIDGPGGKKHVTTFVSPRGDALVGKIWQDFTVDATTSELRFSVYGGDARVLLLRGNEVVRATQARRTNDTALPVVWTLSSFRGQKLRLMVDDSLSGAWGFVSVSGFELH